ncbi:MAG: hypothetical protein LUG16_02505 [Candidatus Gastranaerophilales bacterium]|nr:hypothetical protein [Candidatus Gastranaerophilales bacterium]
MGELLKKEYDKIGKIYIIAHRGYWKTEQEKNTKVAFERAFDCNFGIETDLRDIKGTIVISHDCPRGNEITFEEVLQILNGRNLPLALNIKADGLADEIKRLLKKYNHTNYFTFDMSIPEMVYQHKSGLSVFTGKSDIIPNPIMFEEAQGVWLDCFNSDWFGAEEVQDILNHGKKVCIVSPDLHKREYKTIWQRYKNIAGIMLCTDYPDEAKEFFND